MTTPPPPTSSALRILLVAVIGASLIGYLLATSETFGPGWVGSPTEEAPEGVSTAPTWELLRQSPRSQAAIDEDLAALRLATLDLPPRDRLEARAARAARRAYEGAPPTIPHVVRQDSAAECLACHGEGLQIRGRTAAALSHDAFTSCTQCHVTQVKPMPGELDTDPRAVDNRFHGLAGRLHREAWSNLPPLIPHREHMRERCESCHGPGGSFAIAEVHPVGVEPPADTHHALHLDDSGSLHCTSCHIQVQHDAAATRTGASVDATCLSCHDESTHDALLQSLGVVGEGHPTGLRLTEGIEARRLEGPGGAAGTSACLSCHQIHRATPSVDPCASCHPAAGANGAGHPPAQPRRAP